MSYLSGKTVSLIGGTGFVGRALTEKLLNAGARVVILARNAERAKRLKTCPQRPFKGRTVPF